MRPAIKYQAIFKNKDAYSISFLCTFFGVSRSGYYKWLRQKDKPDRDLTLGKLIQECQQKTKHTYGYRRVSLWLSKYQGLRGNKKKVLRVMRKYGQLSEIRRPGPYQKGITRFKTYENLLNQDFHAKKPNEKWVSDISYIHTKQGTLYLAVIKDLFDHSIVTYEMGTRQDNGLITRLIEKAKRQIRKGTVIHSDQGGQYSSKEYFLLSEKCGFIPSMSRKATPLDNACAESFFSTLKTECIYRHTIKTLDDAKQLIRFYIYFYNHQRIQLSTGCTPLEKRRFTA